MLCTPPGKTTEKWPPLGLLYIAASIKQKRKDEVEVVDAFCMNLSKDELVARVKEYRPDVFGMNCSTHTYLQAIEVYKDLSNQMPDMKLVLGGYHATFASESILRQNPFIDFIIKGEAEEAFPMLLDHIEKGTEPMDVAGISYLKDGQQINNKLALIEKLDPLPSPDRTMLKGVEYGYHHSGIPLTFGKFTTMSTSRGCPYDCRYCSCAAFSLRHWRYRSAESVVSEMEELQRQGYKSVVLVDDNFTQRPDRVFQICDLMEEKGIHLRLYCEGRVNTAGLDMLKRMKQVGFDVIYFGCESASPKVLEYYNKRINPDMIAQAVGNAKEAGMIVLTSFILGAEIETKEDMEQTLQFIRRLRPHAVEINILDYLVGTPLWNEAVEKGIIKPEDWTTNHRVFEYGLSPLDKDGLQQMVNEGYDTYLDAWKNRQGVKELFRLIRRNGTARQIIFSNIFNRDARAAVMNGIKPFEEKKPVPEKLELAK
ncbi:MAG: biotin synthase [Methanomassiliicoccales archaeon PtaU1.Bin124]|nr:MAG: biotin synthase [Methanomassiliicoccales archaeon PtaU1.Bin124]